MNEFNLKEIKRYLRKQYWLTFFTGDVEARRRYANRLKAIKVFQ